MQSGLLENDEISRTWSAPVQRTKIPVARMPKAQTAGH